MTTSCRKSLHICYLGKENMLVFCVESGEKLLIRADRPSIITLYTDSYGMLPAIHYHKYSNVSDLAITTAR